MYHSGDSLIDQILEFLGSLPIGLSRRELWARYMESYKKDTFYNALSKLKKKELIITGEDKLRLTEAGRKYWKKRAQVHKTFSFPEKYQTKGRLLLLYDIPESRKGDREWFRFQLRELGYKMVQRSVWIGPDPLPKDFLEYVQLIGLKDCLRFFRLKK